MSPGDSLGGVGQADAYVATSERLRGHMLSLDAP